MLQKEKKCLKLSNFSIIRKILKTILPKEIYEENKRLNRIK
jgi:hypothetical protein